LNKEKDILNLDEMQRYFGMWLNSKPFDIGITTRNALSVIKNLTKDAMDPTLSFKHNLKDTKSLSNGCLMRITPLAVWGHKLSKDDLYLAVKYQTMFTHANPTAINATYLYCYAIKLLIKEDLSMKDMGKKVFEKIVEEAKIRQGAEPEKLDEWLKIITETEYNEEGKKLLPPPTKSIGFLKIAFVWSFFYLYHDISYKEAIKDILLQGGDTDTNAAIVGGLLGARYGLSDEEELKWRDKVLNYDYDRCQHRGHLRPDYLRPTHLLHLIKQTYDSAPRSLKIKCQGQYYESGRAFFDSVRL
jgi:ADP-ribosyl-[dinitrogen reductase] hydrolase